MRTMEIMKTTKTAQTATCKELSTGLADIMETTEMTEATGIRGANHGFPKQRFKKYPVRFTTIFWRAAQACWMWSLSRIGAPPKVRMIVKPLWPPKPQLFGKPLTSTLLTSTFVFRSGGFPFRGFEAKRSLVATSLEGFSVTSHYLEDHNLLKLRRLDSSCLFFLSDKSIWGQ